MNLVFKRFQIDIYLKRNQIFEFCFDGLLVRDSVVFTDDYLGLCLTEIQGFQTFNSQKLTKMAEIEKKIRNF